MARRRLSAVEEARLKGRKGLVGGPGGKREIKEAARGTLACVRVGGGEQSFLSYRAQLLLGYTDPP